ncbi:HNH endonuclease, partial [Knoellia sp. CPCC 206435]|uniref:HNH endonuclease n=1 Tax=Knoellia terrae TaxID=3404797 RepID=UPI003B43CFBA
APASWCDAHHLIHWADGGPSDLSNAALLCPRHHTTVHSQRFHGWVAADSDGRSHVVWDRTRGAYDTALEGVDSGTNLNSDLHLDRASGDDGTHHRR